MSVKTRVCIVAWVVCGLFAYGIALGDFQGSYPEFAYSQRGSDMAFSLVMAALGPVGLGLSFLESNFCEHGLRFRPLSKTESVLAFHKRWPTLDYEDFNR